MTGEIVIKMGAPPKVFVDGIEVGVSISVDFHKSGSLDVKNLTIRGIATGEKIAAAQEFQARTDDLAENLEVTPDGR